jgi:hypothetical protein
MADFWMKKAFNPAHRGLFTEKAHRMGLGVQAAARHVLAEGSDASTKTKRQAALAERAGSGGDIHALVSAARRKHSIRRSMSR